MAGDLDIFRILAYSVAPAQTPPARYPDVTSRLFPGRITPARP